MKTLNLAYPDRSEIKFKISKFPDGQQTVDILEPLSECDVKLMARLTSFTDLELIICANAALKGLGTLQVHLYVPYFLGARSDRKFMDGGSNYLKDVICPIINAQKFRTVLVLDPHSDVLEACLDNFEKVNNHLVVKYALANISLKNSNIDYIKLVSPDAGALKKVYSAAEHFGIEHVIVASKHRDLKTGKITHTDVPNIEQNDNVAYLIVDDICDGGRTFTEIAKVIKSKRPDLSIYLAVTHGIFSAGFDELNKYFDMIYTTNSFKDSENSQLLQFNVL